MIRQYLRRALSAAAVAIVVHAATAPTGGCAVAAEPPALNPFAPVQRDRDDAIPGYVETSDGKIHRGSVYMTRDKRLKILDPELNRQREIPLRVVQQIECKVLKKWMEKEWRFKELALDEKYHTGRQYPAIECEYTITLHDGRTITGALAEIIYVRPYVRQPDKPGTYRPEAKPEKFLLHKRLKGEFGENLKSLVYVKLIKLGAEKTPNGQSKPR